MTGGILLSNYRDNFVVTGTSNLQTNSVPSGMICQLSSNSLSDIPTRNLQKSLEIFGKSLRSLRWYKQLVISLFCSNWFAIHHMCSARSNMKHSSWSQWGYSIEECCAIVFHTSAVFLQPLWSFSFLHLFATQWFVCFWFFSTNSNFSFLELARSKIIDHFWATINWSFFDDSKLLIMEKHGGTVTVNYVDFSRFCRFWI